MGEHPTPWRAIEPRGAYSASVEDAAGKVVACDVPEGLVDVIVRAVNAHARLVALVRRLDAFDGGVSTDDTLSDLTLAARDVLAEIDGGEG